MSELHDKRTVKRVSIPEAKVYYKKDTGFEPFKRLRGPLPLKDVGTGGACFEIESGLEWGDLFYGDPLYMEIILPNRRKVQVRGNVRWISSLDNTEASFIGLQFTSTEESHRANSKKHIKRLQNYTDEYN